MLSGSQNKYLRPSKLAFNTSSKPYHAQLSDIDSASDDTDDEYRLKMRAIATRATRRVRSSPGLNLIARGGSDFDESESLEEDLGEFFTSTNPKEVEGTADSPVANAINSDDLLANKEEAIPLAPITAGKALTQAKFCRLNSLNVPEPSEEIKLIEVGTGHSLARSPSQPISSSKRNSAQLEEGKEWAGAATFDPEECGFDDPQSPLPKFGNDPNLTTEDEGEDERSVSPSRKLKQDKADPDSEQNYLKEATVFEENSLLEPAPCQKGDAGASAGPGPHLKTSKERARLMKRGKRLSMCLDHLGKLLTTTLHIGGGVEQALF